MAQTPPRALGRRRPRCGGGADHGIADPGPAPWRLPFGLRRGRWDERRGGKPGGVRPGPGLRRLAGGPKRPKKPGERHKKSPLCKPRHRCGSPSSDPLRPRRSPPPRPPQPALHRLRRPLRPRRLRLPPPSQHQSRSPHRTRPWTRPRPERPGRTRSSRHPPFLLSPLLPPPSPTLPPPLRCPLPPRFPLLRLPRLPHRLPELRLLGRRLPGPSSRRPLRFPNRPPRRSASQQRPSRSRCQRSRCLRSPSPRGWHRPRDRAWSRDPPARHLPRRGSSLAQYL